LGLVGHTIVTCFEGCELLDVGARHKGLSTGATKHHGAHAGIRFERFAVAAELLVHGPGHRVARLGSVEGHRGHTLLDGKVHGA
jgi:hypothetical protein